MTRDNDDKSQDHIGAANIVTGLSETCTLEAQSLMTALLRSVKKQTKWKAEFDFIWLDAMRGGG